MIKVLLFILSFIFFLLSCSPKNKFLDENISDNVLIVSDIPGNGLAIANHYIITVHYRAFLEDGNEFDSSYKRKKPFTFQYGLRQVIEGWEIGLKNIKSGGKRTIKIPPELAYGSKGIKNLIPPNSYLIFDIEVMEIKPHNYTHITSDVLKDYKNENLLDFKKNKLILIDIRTKDKVLDSGLIEYSIHIEAFNINGEMNKNFMKKYKSFVNKNDHVILISEYGEISSILANGLVENLGMKNVYSLKGGINKWIKIGNKVVK